MFRMNRPAPRDKRNPRAIRLALSAGLSLGAIIGLVGCAEEADQVEADAGRCDPVGERLQLQRIRLQRLQLQRLSLQRLQLQRLQLQRHGVQRHELQRHVLQRHVVQRHVVQRPVDDRRPVVDQRPDDDRGRPPVRRLHGQDRLPVGSQPDQARPVRQSRTRSRAPWASRPRSSAASAMSTARRRCRRRCSRTSTTRASTSASGWSDRTTASAGARARTSRSRRARTSATCSPATCPGNYCTGKNMGAGDSKGRLGSPFGNNDAIMNAPYGWQWDNASSQNVPPYCVHAGQTRCTVQNEGFSSVLGSGRLPRPRWNHVVTVYRNFEPTMLFKICNKNGGNKCLGVVDGSHGQRRNVEQRALHRRGRPDLDHRARRPRASTRSSTSRAACRWT